jgi:hypothetical protein
MASMKRFVEEKDGPRIVGQSPIRLLVSLSPITTTPIKRAPPRRSDTSDSSSAASYQGSTSPSDPPSPTVFSQNPSPSSVASSAPSLAEDPLNEQLATMSISSQRRNHELPCILNEILGCNAVFSGSRFEDWYSHSLTHYGDAGPPNHAMCIFCHTLFDSPSPQKCWRKRMQHIADHFEMGWTIEDSRPDFKVLEDMANKERLSWARYKDCALGTERPSVDGLRPYDWEPEEVVEKRLAHERAENQVVVTDSRRELRNRTHRPTRNGRSRRVEVKNPNDRSA